MPQEIFEFRRDKDTYHVVMGEVGQDPATARTAAIPVTEDLKEMPEAERLIEVSNRARAATKPVDPKSGGLEL